ncbi:adenine-specific DNA-methyltransferase [Azospirillaceae bacterium]
MNRSKLKTYAPNARRDFINAVSARAAKVGIGEKKIEPVHVQGEVAIIAGQAHPKRVAEQRAKLEARIGLRGYEQVMEEAAYTWFNRFAAIRYMELHGYLDHGYRVLSHPQGKATPEILEHAQHLDLPGLDAAKVLELKLDGTKDADLYRMLLLAQCNALYEAMPFLFERIDNETELLLPDNLLHSDSVINKMVNEIDESDWQEIEIIGWLYQFYISEKKDQVIGKVVKSEDIPAATQLFTPNWIVKYMVQNTLGAKWLATYPQSGIRAKMEYYIEPAEQTPEVNAKLAEITPSELNPEVITFLDPACGSGHILVEAYELLKEIYLERGYVLRDIPKLILEKNLFGLDIDDRAAQLACFALLMKARADDRRIFSRQTELAVMAIQESNGLDSQEVCTMMISDQASMENPNNNLFINSATRIINDTDIAVWVSRIIDKFSNAKTFGSLIEPDEDNVANFMKKVDAEIKAPDRNLSQYAMLSVIEKFRQLLRQLGIISGRFDCVVANPPYMGRQFQNDSIRDFLSLAYSEYKYDIYSAISTRMIGLCKDDGYLGFMTPFTWMSKSSYVSFRKRFINDVALLSLIQPEYHAFFDNAFVPICTFTARNTSIPGFCATFFDLGQFSGADIQSVKVLEGISDRKSKWVYHVQIERFSAIPSAQFAFSLPSRLLEAFKTREPIGQMAKKGITTGDNTIFMRLWFEVNMSKFSYFGGVKWYPITKGGQFRRWYGNFEYVIDWEDNGMRIKNFYDGYGKLKSSPRNIDYLFREGITWNDVTVSDFTARYVPKGHAFSAAGPMIFTNEIDKY